MSDAIRESRSNNTDENEKKSPIERIKSKIDELIPLLENVKRTDLQEDAYKQLLEWQSSFQTNPDYSDLDFIDVFDFQLTQIVAAEVKIAKSEIDRLISLLHPTDPLVKIFQEFKDKLGKPKRQANGTMIADPYDIDIESLRREILELSDKVKKKNPQAFVKKEEGGNSPEKSDGFFKVLFRRIFSGK